ncbi:hypothetical protein Plhal703r1_c20g0088851 [Plasmopara halstedii]
MELGKLSTTQHCNHPPKPIMLANGDRVHESCDVSWDRWLKVENTPRRSEQTSTKSNDRDVIIYVARELQEIWNSFRQSLK